MSKKPDAAALSGEALAKAVAAVLSAQLKKRDVQIAALTARVAHIEKTFGVSTNK